VNNQNQQEPAGDFVPGPDGGPARRWTRCCGCCAAHRWRCCRASSGWRCMGSVTTPATELAGVRAEDNAGPLLGGAQPDEHRIARAGAEGVDKPEQRFADESLGVIPDEQ
jgi:hypothetical protein